MSKTCVKLWPLAQAYIGVAKNFIWVFFVIFYGKYTDILANVYAELPISYDACIGKDPDTGKDWRQKKKAVAEDEIIR